MLCSICYGDDAEPAPCPACALFVCRLCTREHASECPRAFLKLDAVDPAPPTPVGVGAGAADELPAADASGQPDAANADVGMKPVSWPAHAGAAPADSTADQLPQEATGGLGAAFLNRAKRFFSTPSPSKQDWGTKNPWTMLTQQAKAEGGATLLLRDPELIRLVVARLAAEKPERNFDDQGAATLLLELHDCSEARAEMPTLHRMVLLKSGSKLRCLFDRMRENGHFYDLPRVTQLLGNAIEQFPLEQKNYEWWCKEASESFRRSSAPHMSQLTESLRDAPALFEQLCRWCDHNDGLHSWFDLKLWVALQPRRPWGSATPRHLQDQVKLLRKAVHKPLSLQLCEAAEVTREPYAGFLGPEKVTIESRCRWAAERQAVLKEMREIRACASWCPLEEREIVARSSATLDHCTESSAAAVFSRRAAEHLNSWTADREVWACAKLLAPVLAGRPRPPSVPEQSAASFVAAVRLCLDLEPLTVKEAVGVFEHIDPSRSARHVKLRGAMLFLQDVLRTPVCDVWLLICAAATDDTRLPDDLGSARTGDVLEKVVQLLGVRGKDEVKERDATLLAIAAVWTSELQQLFYGVRHRSHNLLLSLHSFTKDPRLIATITGAFQQVFFDRSSLVLRIVACFGESSQNVGTFRERVGALRTLEGEVPQLQRVAPLLVHVKVLQPDARAVEMLISEVTARPGAAISPHLRRYEALCKYGKPMLVSKDFDLSDPRLAMERLLAGPKSQRCFSVASWSTEDVAAALVASLVFVVEPPAGSASAADLAELLTVAGVTELLSFLPELHLQGSSSSVHFHHFVHLVATLGRLIMMERVSGAAITAVCGVLNVHRASGGVAVVEIDEKVTASKIFSGQCPVPRALEDLKCSEEDEKRLVHTAREQFPLLRCFTSRELGALHAVVRRGVRFAAVGPTHSAVAQFCGCAPEAVMARATCLNHEGNDACDSLLREGDDPLFREQQHTAPPFPPSVVVHPFDPATPSWPVVILELFTAACGGNAKSARQALHPFLVSIVLADTESPEACAAAVARARSRWLPAAAVAAAATARCAPSALPMCVVLPPTMGMDALHETVEAFRSHNPAELLRPLHLFVSASHARRIFDAVSRCFANDAVRLEEQVCVEGAVGAHRVLAHPLRLFGSSSISPDGLVRVAAGGPQSGKSRAIEGELRRLGISMDQVCIIFLSSSTTVSSIVETLLSRSWAALWIHLVSFSSVATTPLIFSLCAFRSVIAAFSVVATIPASTPIFVEAPITPGVSSPNPAVAVFPRLVLQSPPFADALAGYGLSTDVLALTQSFCEANTRIFRDVYSYLVGPAFGRGCAPLDAADVKVLAAWTALYIATPSPTASLTRDHPAAAVCRGGTKTLPAAAVASVTPALLLVPAANGAPLVLVNGSDRELESCVPSDVAKIFNGAVGVAKRQVVRPLRGGAGAPVDLHGVVEDLFGRKAPAGVAMRPFLVAATARLKLVRGSRTLSGVLVGETGTGKTLMLRTVASLMGAECWVTEVTCGTQLRHLRADLLKCAQRHREAPHEPLIYFFDECNTTALQDLIHEVVMRRRWSCSSNEDDQLISSLVADVDHVFFVAAANPYRIVLDEGHQYPLENGAADVRPLYAVQSFVHPTVQATAWSMDEPSSAEKELAVRKIIDASSSLQEMLQGDASIPERLARGITTAHDLLAMNVPELPTSLRDADACVQVLVAMRRLVSQDAAPTEVLADAAVACTYYMALPRSQRQVPAEGNADPLKVAFSARMAAWRRFRDHVLDCVLRPSECPELPKGLIWTENLRDSLVGGVTAIHAQRHLLLVGPPGSSKSLALQLLLQLMNAAGTSMRISPHYFQCSSTTTEFALETAYQRAGAAQRETARPVMFVDEVATAETAPGNPLRVFNRLFDNPESPASLMTSNYKVDKAFLNRCTVFVCELLSEEEAMSELKATVQGSDGVANASRVISAFFRFTRHSLERPLVSRRVHFTEAALHIGNRDLVTFLQLQHSRAVLNENQRAVNKAVVQCFGFGVRHRVEDVQTGQLAERPFLHEVAGSEADAALDEADEHHLVRAWVTRPLCCDHFHRPLLLSCDRCSAAAEHLRDACEAFRRHERTDAYRSSTLRTVLIFGDILQQTPVMAATHLRKLRRAMYFGYTAILCGLDYLSDVILDILNSFYSAAFPAGEQSGSAGAAPHARVSVNGSWEMWPVHSEFRCIILSPPRRAPLAGSFLPPSFYDRLERRWAKSRRPELSNVELYGDPSAAPGSTMETELEKFLRRTVAEAGGDALFGLAPAAAECWTLDEVLALCRIGGLLCRIAPTRSITEPQADGLRLAAARALANVKRPASWFDPVLSPFRRTAIYSPADLEDWVYRELCGVLANRGDAPLKLAVSHSMSDAALELMLQRKLLHPSVANRDVIVRYDPAGATSTQQLAQHLLALQSALDEKLPPVRDAARHVAILAVVDTAAATDIAEVAAWHHVLVDEPVAEVDTRLLAEGDADARGALLEDGCLPQQVALGRRRLLHILKFALEIEMRDGDETANARKCRAFLTLVREGELFDRCIARRALLLRQACGVNDGGIQSHHRVTASSTAVWVPQAPVLPQWRRLLEDAVREIWEGTVTRSGVVHLARLEVTPKSLEEDAESLCDFWLPHVRDPQSWGDRGRPAVLWPAPECGADSAPPLFCFDWPDDVQKADKALCEEDIVSVRVRLNIDFPTLSALMTGAKSASGAPLTGRELRATPTPAKILQHVAAQRLAAREENARALFWACVSAEGFTRTVARTCVAIREACRGGTIAPDALSDASKSAIAGSLKALQHRSCAHVTSPAAAAEELLSRLTIHTSEERAALSAALEQLPMEGGGEHGAVAASPLLEHAIGSWATVLGCPPDQCSMETCRLAAAARLLAIALGDGDLSGASGLAVRMPRDRANELLVRDLPPGLVKKLVAVGCADLEEIEREAHQCSPVRGVLRCIVRTLNDAAGTYNACMRQLSEELCDGVAYDVRAAAHHVHAALHVDLAAPPASPAVMRRVGQVASSGVGPLVAHLHALEQLFGVPWKLDTVDVDAWLPQQVLPALPTQPRAKEFFSHTLTRHWRTELLKHRDAVLLKRWVLVQAVGHIDELLRDGAHLTDVQLKELSEQPVDSVARKVRSEGFPVPLPNRFAFDAARFVDYLATAVMGCGAPDAAAGEASVATFADLVASALVHGAWSLGGEPKGGEQLADLLPEPREPGDWKALIAGGKRLLTADTATHLVRTLGDLKCTQRVRLALALRDVEQRGEPLVQLIARACAEESVGDERVVALRECAACYDDGCAFAAVMCDCRAHEGEAEDGALLLKHPLMRCRGCAVNHLGQFIEAVRASTVDLSEPLHPQCGGCQRCRVTPTRLLAVVRRATGEGVVGAAQLAEIEREVEAHTRRLQRAATVSFVCPSAFHPPFEVLVERSARTVRCPHCALDRCPRCGSLAHPCITPCDALGQLRSAWPTHLLALRGAVNTRQQIEEDVRRCKVQWENYLQDERSKAGERLCPHCGRRFLRTEGCGSMRCGRDTHGHLALGGCMKEFEFRDAPLYVPDERGEHYENKINSLRSHLREHTGPSGPMPLPCSRCGRRETSKHWLWCAHCALPDEAATSRAARAQREGGSPRLAPGSFMLCSACGADAAEKHTKEYHKHFFILEGV